MDKALKSFNQEAWRHQLDISIHSDAVIAVGGEPVNTQKEEALGWIVLRLNAQAILLKEEVEKWSEKAKALQVETDIWKEYQKLIDTIH